MSRTANLLHAMATAINDRQVSAMTEAAGLGPSAVAVILTLGQYDRQSISEIAAVTALSHSAAVRLVDRLERDGLITRARKQQGRSVPVSLTVKGRRTYTDLRRAQSSALSDILAPLSEEEKAQLVHLAERLLEPMATDRNAKDHICRYCDESVCLQGKCPVETTSREA